MGKRFWTAALLSLCVTLPGCATDDQIVKDLPLGSSFISSVDPATAAPGARVRIVGKDFGLEPGTSGQVRVQPGNNLNPVVMPVESWSDTTIYAVVPQMPPTTSLSSRLQIIDSRGHEAYAPMPFQVVARASQ